MDIIFTYMLNRLRSSNLPVPHSGSQGMAGTVLFVGTLQTLGVGWLVEVAVAVVVTAAAQAGFR